MPPITGALSESVARFIGITKRRFKRVESICLFREQLAAGRQELAFNARPFVLCGLPLRRPPCTQLSHTGRNGKFFLQLISHFQFGLSHGQARLIPVWVATMAVRLSSRIIRSEAASEVLDFFHLFKDGKRHRRIMEGCQTPRPLTIGRKKNFGRNRQSRI